MSHRLEMRGVHTAADATEVIQFKAGGDVADECQVREAMSG
jgi:hypothetical protein